MLQGGVKDKSCVREGGNVLSSPEDDEEDRLCLRPDHITLSQVPPLVDSARNKQNKN